MGRDYAEDGRRASLSSRGRGRGKSRRIPSIDPIPSYAQQVLPKLCRV